MDKDVRRLVLTALSLLVALFVGRTVVGTFWDDEGLRRSVAGLRRSLGRGGEAFKRPERAVMAAASQVVSDLDATLEELIPRLQYVRPPEFDVPSDSSPDLRYIEVLRREQDALVRAARFIGKSVPQDLGMPVPNPNGLEDVLTALRALHVVHLVVSAGFDADIDRVDAIQIPAVKRRGASVGGFLKKSPVEFDVIGSPRALRDMLAALVSGGTWLALDEVRLEALDEDGDSARCRMTVSSVSIDTSATVRPGGLGR
jgi:hypothetical protein